MKLDSLVPMGRRVLVKIPTEIKTEGAFMVDQTKGSSIKEGTLLAAGADSEYQSCKAGTTLVFTPNAGKEFIVENIKVRILADVEILLYEKG